MTARGVSRLSITAPGTYEPERRYVFDLIVGEWLGLAFDLKLAEVHSVEIGVAGSAGRVLTVPDVLFAMPLQKWLTEPSMPTRPLAAGSLPAATRPEAQAILATLPARLPIVFGAAKPGELWRESERGVELAVDVFGSAFFMLSRLEETVERTRDSHGRFPSSASLAAAEGFLGQPIVDQYVAVLRAALLELWPGLPTREPSWTLRPTHDVDFAWSAYQMPARKVLRALATDLARQREPGLFARRGAAFVAARFGRVAFDPFDTFDFLMETSERHDLRSCFYFMTGVRRSPLDGAYQLDDPRLVRALARIHDRGHEVGLHAGYDSFRSSDRLRAEIEALRSACAAAGFDQASWGVRQHFLRLEAPTTWRAQEAAGLAYDSTLGFADRPGFRAGTSHDFPIFDLRQRRVTTLRERPLVAMDATLFSYLGLGLADAAAAVRSVMAATRATGGEPVLLYHNSTLTGGRWKAHYRDLIAELTRG